MKREFVLALLLGAPVASFAQTSAPPSPAPDNSKVNVRDRQPGSTTADQQKNSKGDLEITRKVRQGIVKDKTLSTYAHNIKVVTEGGVVTLRGPVRSSDEKLAIETIAAQVAGEGNVRNELEISPEKGS
jgi:hyperosmotically inducible periplasmic protein